MHAKGDVDDAVEIESTDGTVESESKSPRDHLVGAGFAELGIRS